MGTAGLGLGIGLGLGDGFGLTSGGLGVGFGLTTGGLVLLTDVWLETGGGGNGLYLFQD